MRRLALFAALLLPAPLCAQYPAPGVYKAPTSQAGQDGSFPLQVTVTKTGDSTTIAIGNEPQEKDKAPPAPFPMLDQRAFAVGFQITLGVVDGGLTCRFTPPKEKDGAWEGSCEDPTSSALYVMRLRKAS